MKEIIKKYTDLGITCDIIYTRNPSVCTFSITRKCLVGESGVSALELHGNKLTYENNRLVSLQVHDNPNVQNINQSNGIIVTEYDSDCYRFAFIPTT